MALRYIRPSDCDRASRKYPFYACREAPGKDKFGNIRTECEGTSHNQNDKNTFKDCKECLENCGNNL